MNITDGEETHIYTRNGETSGSLIDFFITKASMADNLVIDTDWATTSDHTIVCAHVRWDEGEGAKRSRKITGWNIDGLRGETEEEKQKFKKYKNSGWIEVQRCQRWMKRAIRKIYKGKLTGFRCYGGALHLSNYTYSSQVCTRYTAVDPIPYNQSSENSSELVSSTLSSSFCSIYSRTLGNSAVPSSSLIGRMHSLTL
jgi:hypothetical protein